MAPMSKRAFTSRCINECFPSFIENVGAITLLMERCAIEPHRPPGEIRICVPQRLKKFAICGVLRRCGDDLKSNIPKSEQTHVNLTFANDFVESRHPVLKYFFLRHHVRRW